MRTQFIFNNKQVGLTTILFSNINPIEDVDKIVYFKETGLVGNFLTKEFRYSWDNSIWSNWATLTQQALVDIVFTNRPEFFLELKYTRENYASADIEDFYLFYDTLSPSNPDPGPPLIDADLLQGEPGTYYLDRANHTGPYTGLIIDNVPDGSTYGVYSHRVDSSFGSEFYFKRITGSGSISISESSTGILTIDASILGPEETYTNPDDVLETVGGIVVDSSFFAPGKTFAETMDAMFYPTRYPTYTAPSSTFTHNVASLQEIAKSINITFNTIFDRGSINYLWQENDYRSGTSDTFSYTNGIRDWFDTDGTDQYIWSGYDVSIGTINSWTADVSYYEGPQPVDSSGTDYETPFPAGSLSAGTVSFEGIYPLYGTTSVISTPSTKQTLYSMLTANQIAFAMVPETGGYKQSFDLPGDWSGSPTNRPLTDIETFNTVSSIWDSTGLTQWTDSSTNHTVQGNSVSYTRYTYNGDNRSSVQIRLIF